MINIEQIQKIKEDINSLKHHLWKSLDKIMKIDDIDLKQKEITFDQANKMRKNLSYLKTEGAHRFNIIISILETELKNKEYFKEN